MSVSKSVKAQGLGTVITTASRFFASDHRLYLKTEGNTVIGLLKVGPKNLFIRNEQGTIKEISPICVLDFYVHESVQRGGYGKVGTKACANLTRPLRRFLRKCCLLRVCDQSASDMTVLLQSCSAF